MNKTVITWVDPNTSEPVRLPLAEAILGGGRCTAATCTGAGKTVNVIYKTNKTVSAMNKTVNTMNNTVNAIVWGGCCSTGTWTGAGVSQIR